MKRSISFRLPSEASAKISQQASWQAKFGEKQQPRKDRGEQGWCPRWQWDMDRLWNHTLLRSSLRSMRGHL